MSICIKGNITTKFFILLLSLASHGISSQALAHAHNDYERSQALTSALEYGITSIEIDVFLHNKKIVIAHDKEDIDSSFTLKKIYLQPIKKSLSQADTIQLLIDIKEYSVELLNTLQNELLASGLPLTSKVNDQKDQITIILSGDMDKSYIIENHYPIFYIDGRPEDLDKEEWHTHIKMISDNFKNYMDYEGLGVPKKKELDKINSLIKQCEQIDIPIRFWNTADHLNVWKLLDKLNVDYISIDDYRNFSNYRRGSPITFPKID